MSTLDGYRSDIDGLRAVAVLSVLIYHLGVSFVPGGFVGVDVFFVISGFLITSIVYRENREGNFSYARFYERRIRRLFPALAVMLLLTSVPGWLLLLPEDYKLYTEAQGLSVLFLSNIHFWNNTDYFNDAVEHIPLLHTWSLAVEEQFYLFFPPLFLFLSRFFPRHVGILLLGLALISLLATENLLSESPESAFYLVHYRGWELLAGALLAIGTIPPIRKQWLREAASMSGIFLIIASVLFLDKQSRFPGLAAFPAVLGSVLIIQAGQNGKTLAGRVLSLRPLVFVGLISYSLYLWHWPLIVFTQYVVISPLSGMQQFLLFLLSVSAGWLSWRFVEKRFRRAPGVFSRRKFFRNTGVVAAALVVLALPGIVTDGAPFRLPDDIVALNDVAEESIPFRKGCFGLEPHEIQEQGLCRLGSEGSVDFLLWGDSHALALAHALDIAAKDIGSVGYFAGKSACPPVIGSREFRASASSCQEFNNQVVRFLSDRPEIRHVILAGYWGHYQQDGERGDDYAEYSFAAGLKRTLQLLAAQNIKVTVIDQVPEAAMHVPSALARSRYFDRPVDIDTNLLEHRASLKYFHEAMGNLEDIYKIAVFRPEEVLCDASRCFSQLDGRPLYRDSHHLSRWGGEQLVFMAKAVLVDPE